MLRMFFSRNERRKCIFTVHPNQRPVSLTWDFIIAFYPIFLPNKQSATLNEEKHITFLQVILFQI